MSYMDPVQGKKYLLELQEALDSIHLPCFLMQGTCLGAVRDHGFVPTEKDIDLGFLAEHFKPCVMNLCRILRKRGWKIETADRTHPFQFYHTIVPSKDGIRADLVSWHIWKDCRFAIAPNNKQMVPERYALVHPKHLIETWDQIELFGKQWNVPSPVEKYLEGEYSDWKTPREDHISRSRIYHFLESENIPYDHWK